MFLTCNFYQFQEKLQFKFKYLYLVFFNVLEIIDTNIPNSLIQIFNQEKSKTKFAC